MRLVLLLLALLLATPAFADSASAPFALYAAGRYEDAMKAGAAANNATGYSIAARAALADASARDRPCLDCLKRAEDYARRATASDPKQPDGHTYLAVSLGLEARIVGPVIARLHDYPGEAKTELDAALSDDPKNFWALAALGGWNVEIVRTGGDRLADWLYSASLAKGLESFAAAVKGAPNNIAVRYQIGLSLAGYDPDRFRDQILDAWTRAAAGTPGTAYEKLAQKRAGELLDLLKRNDRRRLDARVRKYQGYP